MKPNSKYIAPRLGGLASRLAWNIRKKIFDQLMRSLKPTKLWTILDVGVTSDRTKDSNFFEKLYPYSSQITAIGLEDASFLEKEFPGLRFMKLDAKKLPFKDKSFDLAFCSAVIEHVGPRKEQEKLLKELSRVAKQVVVTTPNRFFPLEFHTLTPLIHWLPHPIFGAFLKLTGRSFFAATENLNLLSENEIEAMLKRIGVNYKKNHQLLMGLKSNLVYYVTAFR